MSIVIWHNPRCSKSRQTLALLQENGVSPDIRLYLENPPTQAELARALDALGMVPSQLLRKGETEYKALGLKTASEDQCLAAMVAHPRLIERPIVLNGEKAALGRPPENCLGVI